MITKLTATAMTAVCGCLIAGGVGTGCVSDSPTIGGGERRLAPGGVASSVERTVFAVDGEEFDAVVHRPASSKAIGWGVLLIGGGMGNDLDWSTPGVVHVNGQPIATSITGERYADAPAISAELVARGFVVVRWSTIARGDPLAAEWPSKATPRSLANLLKQARGALRLLQGERGVKPDQLALLGHSLGAARSFTIAAEESAVRAVIALSPAYFTSQTPAPVSFTQAGMRRGQEVMQERELPVLAVFGSLDRSPVVDAAGVQAIAETASQLEVMLIRDVGHQLGPQDGSRHGPIDAEVVHRVGRWLEDRVADARSGFSGPR
jgi:dienelactone hydrolase